MMTAAMTSSSTPVPMSERVVLTRETKIQAAMLEKHLPMIHDAGKKGVQILCLQEIFNGPYFCAEQNTKLYESAEPMSAACNANLSSPVARSRTVIRPDSRPSRVILKR